MKKPTQKALLEAVREDPALLHRLHRLLQPPKRDRPVTSPWSAMEVVAPHLVGTETEALVILGLDAKNRVQAVDVLTRGSHRYTIVDPPHVFRWALTIEGGPASAIVLAHNHPSGDPDPSPQDYEVTRRIADAGALLGVKLLDHLVVVDENRYASIRERNSSLFPAHLTSEWTS